MSTASIAYIPNSCVLFLPAAGNAVTDDQALSGVAGTVEQPEVLAANVVLPGVAGHVEQPEVPAANVVLLPGLGGLGEQPEVAPANAGGTGNSNNTSTQQTITASR